MVLLLPWRSGQRRHPPLPKKKKNFVAAHMKEYPQIWKDILATIDTEKKTIPEVVDALQITPEMVTWHLMTMNKYGVVSPAGTNQQEKIN